MRITKIIAVAALCVLVSACSSNDELEIPDLPEQEIYEDALEALELDNYVLAIEKLQLLEARYPFGRYSEQAQLELTYAYFKNFEPEAARASADRFIRLHPNHDNIDYAYYLKGLTAFEQDRTFFIKYLPLDETKRDPGAALDGFESFRSLVRLYPDSEYAPDARKRMVHLKNRLATYEVHVAHYYIQRGAYLAAANRGRYVIENLQKTPAIPAALAVMVEAYTLLGQVELADDAMAVLNANYPNYVYRPVKESEKTLLDAATFDLFRGAPEAPAPVINTLSDEEAEEKRSWLNRLSFGLFGDDGEEDAKETQDK
ncbi:outer membrane protein assembly factor BamD [Pontibacterium sp.]|uniref:outer membrane protein assembly factor BamD n=1 Tax=Pontibacterium sp. TaxID=2036026 RepID=UPI0035624638